MNAARDEFLRARRAGIGGSDLAAVLGLSPYKTPFQIWREKTGRDDLEPTPEQAERMHWGTVLESVVANHYAEVSGRTIQRINATLVHREHPCIIGHLDRVTVTPGSRARWDAKAGRVLGADLVLEVKTASAYALRSDGAEDAAGWGIAGTDQVPQHYWLQVQHYMGISGLETADLAVLFGGQTFRTYTIGADRALLAEMLAQAAAWWQAHVVADMPPQPTTEAEAKLAWARHREGASVSATAEVAAAVAELRALREQMAALEGQEQALRDRITCAFGEAETLAGPGGAALATWKANKPSSRTDWQACAIECGADDARIARFTTTKPGARVLRLSKA